MDRRLPAIVVSLLAPTACAADPADVRPADSAAPVDSVEADGPVDESPPIEPVEPVGPPAFDEPATISADTHGLTATLEQYREDEVAGRISIKVTNGGDEPVVVETLRLAWPGLTDTGPAELDYPVFPGVRVDLRAPLGRAVCSSPPQLTEPTPDLPIAAVAGTDEGDIVFPVTDPAGILDRIYPRQCTRQAVEHAVGLSIGDEFADRSTDPVEMVGTLEVERRAAAGDVTVLAVHGSVLVGLTTAEGAAVLATGQDRLAVPIVASNNRCDAHAIGEAKKPYVFVVDLLLGDEPVSYVISPDEQAKEALRTGIVGRCPPETDP